MSELPQGWAWATLGEVVKDARPGFPTGRHNATGSGFPHLRPMNVNRDGRIDLEKLKYVEGGGDQRIARGDVLFNNTNSPDLVGKTAYFDLDGEWAYSNHMTRLRSSDAVDGRFLAYQLHWLWILGFYKTILSHHVNQASVATKTLLARVQVVVPPLTEQRRIVAAIEEQLSRLEAAEASLVSAAARLDVLRRRVLNEVTQLDGDVVRVGDVTDVQGGIQKQPKRRPVKNSFPFLRVANVRRGELDLSDVHRIELFDGELERLALRPGDLLVVEGNGSPEQIGRCGLWRGEIPNCVHQNHLIRVRPGPRVDPEYLSAYWNAPSTARAISAVASSTSGLYTLSTTKVKSVAIVVPTLDEQRRAVARLEELTSLIRGLHEEIEHARGRAASLRRALLSKAFRGELVPHDPADEPASLLLERIAGERRAQPPRRRRRASARA